MITKTLLLSLKACDQQVELFAQTWPKGLKIPKALKSQQALATKLTALKFDINWVTDNLLTHEQRAEYRKIQDPAWGEYYKIQAPAYTEYLKIQAPALTEYEKIQTPAWAEYKKIQTPAWAEYEKIIAPAWAEYKKIEAPALTEYEEACWLQIIKLLTN